MSKTKEEDKIIRTKVKEPKFIRFTPLQSNYLGELYTRHMGERNRGLESVYKELGIVEKILEAPPGTYQLRKDLSGLDIVSVPSPPDPPPDSPKDDEPPGKSGKDN